MKLVWFWCFKSYEKDYRTEHTLIFTFGENFFFSWHELGYFFIRNNILRKQISAVIHTRDKRLEKTTEWLQQQYFFRQDNTRNINSKCGGKNALVVSIRRRKNDEFSKYNKSLGKEWWMIWLKDWRKFFFRLYNNSLR